MKNTGIALVWLVIAASACSGAASDQGAGAGVGTDGRGTPGNDTGNTAADDTLGWPDGLLSVDGCVSAWVDASEPSSATYVRRSYDAEQRLVTESPVDAAGLDIDAADPHQSRALYHRLDAEGRVLVKAGGGGGYRPFRQDFARDAQGNVIDSRYAYSDTLELDGELSGDIYGWVTYTNDYDIEGRLTAHTVSDQDEDGMAGSYAYTHDDLGRCATSVLRGASTGDESSRFQYDDAGRLSRLTLETLHWGVQFTQVGTLGYDEEGRLVREERDGGGYEVPAPVDGALDSWTLTRYYADGRKSEESVSLVSDEVNDTIVVDGTPRSASHYIEYASAGCAALEAAIPKPTSTACSADW